MANICSFNMKVIGKHEDIEKFYNAMSQNGKIYMGRGAAAEISYHDDCAFIDGWCKWSVISALIHNAQSMRTEPERWHWGNGDPSELEFITIVEATEKWNLVVEVYSEECGCCFQEHYVFDNGDILVDECVDYYEHWIEEYSTKEEAEEELGIFISTKEWEENEGYIIRGGFDDWEFTI